MLSPEIGISLKSFLTAWLLLWKKKSYPNYPSL